MGGRRVTGRFFIIISLIVVLLVIIIRQLVFGGGGEAVVVHAATRQNYTVLGVIVRDEPVATVDGNSTVVFVAAEGAQVSPGDEIADVYSAAYSLKELEQLEASRQDIRAYHNTILRNIVDADLNRLEDMVRYRALEFKAIVGGKLGGSIDMVEQQLVEAMQARQEYLRQNRLEDSKLTALYEAESTRASKITSWISKQTAASSGMVSFYVDGCEQFLSPSNIESITAAELRNIAGGWTPDVDNSSRLVKTVYRIVDDGTWYVLLAVRDGELNTVTGQTFHLQFEGFSDVVHSAIVDNIKSDGRDTVISLRITDPIGPLINLRSGNVTVSAEIEGLLVPAGSIAYNNDQVGVYVIDAFGGASFVPVQELARSGGEVLVKPINEGMLVAGQRVRK